MTAFEARTSRARVAIQLGACGMFIGLGVLMLPIPVGWLVIAGFAIWFLAILPQMFRLQLELRIDADGIWWRRWSDQTVLWSMVARVRVLNMNQTRAVYVYLADDAVRKRRAGLPDMALRLTGTDRKFDELLAAMRTFGPSGLIP